MQLILASQSPRRQELLKLIGIPYRVECGEVDEGAPGDMAPAALVERLALKKARAVFESNPNACVVGADTVVYIDGRVIGKPRSDEDAYGILSRLQGRTHTVFTGVAALSPKGQEVRHARTDVTFAPMTREEIVWYIATGEPRDKAGAYGIQGPGGMFVEGINGNYFNVIGMPLPLLYAMLQNAGFTLGCFAEKWGE
ncbi:MAG: Maf family protein [Clostridiales bacterium]|jgi:septum formation protein|nr:Maf family protein [Clostridiales bacterium]